MTEQGKGKKPGGSPRGDSPRSSFMETTFGMNAGTGPNASRNVYKASKHGRRRTK